MHCGHGGICTNCAFEIVEIKNECYLCRQIVNQVVQLKYPVNYNGIYQALCITDIIVEEDDEESYESENYESQNDNAAQTPHQDDSNIQTITDRR